MYTYDHSISSPDHPPDQPMHILLTHATRGVLYVLVCGRGKSDACELQNPKVVLCTVYPCVKILLLFGENPLEFPRP